jgi:hypothetical protein
MPRVVSELRTRVVVSGCHESSVIAVELLGAFRDMRITKREIPSLSSGRFVAEPDELQAGVGIKVDQVAVGRGAGNSAEYVDARSSLPHIS